jgi:hypothetical protein
MNKNKATTYEQRMKLKKAMGNRCERCGATGQLEFHDRLSRGSEHHGLGSAARIRWYRSEWNKGNIELLCVLCHRRIELNARLKADKEYVEKNAIARGVPFRLMEACKDLWPDIPAPPSALGKKSSPFT